MNRLYTQTLSVIVLVFLFWISVSPVSAASSESISSYASDIGVWNNFDFQNSPENWSEAAHKFGGPKGVVDLVVAMGNSDGRTFLPFAFESNDHIYSTSTSDVIEPYLSEFESENLPVILSIQPMKANVTEVIEKVLAQYGQHQNIIGINVDLEWKETGQPNHVSDQERDLWLRTMKQYNPNLVLFLTYFGNDTYFPNDSSDIVILYDGENASQSNLLKDYSVLAKKYSSVGIYTGYSSSVPPTPAYERIFQAAPNTKYILHTDDVFSDIQANKPVIIFEMDDVQVDWLENISVNLINLHMQKSIPVVVAVIPNYLDNNKRGGGYLPILLRDLNYVSADIFEIGQHGYTHNSSEELFGKTYEEQKEIILKGQTILKSVGIDTRTFIPTFDSADTTTVTVTQDLGFENFITSSRGLASDQVFIMDSVIPLTERAGNTTVLKSSSQLMKDIDSSGQKAIIISYQIFDFQPLSGNSIEDLGKIMDDLKSSGKYRFMTVREYSRLYQQDSLPDLDDEPFQNSLDGIAPFVPLGLVGAVFLIIFLFIYLMSR